MPIQQFLLACNAAYLPETSALFDEMTTPPTGARADAYNNFIQGLKADGIWDDLEIMYVAASQHIDDAKINIKLPADLTTRSATVGTGSPWTSNVGWRCQSPSNVQRCSTTTIAGLPNFDHNNCTFGVVSSGNHNSTNFEIYEDNAGTFRLTVGSEGVTVDYMTLAESGGTRTHTTETANRCVHAMKRVGGATSVASFNGEPFTGIGSYSNINDQTQFTNTLKIAYASNTFEDARVPLFFYYSVPLSDAQITLLNTRCEKFMEELEVPGFAISAETTALLAAMNVQPDATRRSAINQLISALKQGGAAAAWDKFDLIYVLAAHDEQAARLNWKNPGINTLADVDEAPTSPGLVFSVDDGFTTAQSHHFSAGVTWDALTKFSRDSASLVAWSKDYGGGGTGNQELSDGYNNINPRISLNTNNTANATTILNDQTAMVGGGAGGGFYVADRTDANSRQLRKNNAILANSDSVASTNDPSLTANVQVARFAGAGAARTVMFAAVGSTFQGGATPQNPGTVYWAVREYLRKVGAI